MATGLVPSIGYDVRLDRIFEKAAGKHLGVEKGRYAVETGPSRTVIHEGNNYERAVEVTNFWDERQDTWLVDRLEGRRNGRPIIPTDPAGLACWRLDALAGAYLRGEADPYP